MQRGTSGNIQHPADWERQRERLSAYLDGALEPAERAELELHLADCAACQDELRELRELRGLLRAMPTPVAPRSFLLPESGAVPQSLAPRRAAAPGRRRPSQQGPRVVQWAGALVASLGLALLLGTLLASQGALSQTAASTGPLGSGQNAQTTSGSPSATVPSINQNRTPQVSDPSAGTSTTAPDASATPSATFTQNRDRGTATSVESVPPILPISGAGLFVGGAVVFVVGRTSAKRRSAA